MRVTLDWLGVATFRLTIGNLVVFLDAYLDRVPAAPPVGLTTADVARADYVLVGHSHFDHLWGAERIAARTGAIVIGSHETVRLLHDVDRIPERQLRPDVALLAAMGRGNVNGDPVQGTLAQFIASEVEMLRPRRVVLCHHDDWMPPLTRPVDPGPIRHELARRTPEAQLVDMGYLAGYPILG